MARITSQVAQDGSLRVTPSLCASGLGLGTLVQTADGELPVEFLSPSDRIVTRNAGLQRLAHVAVRTVPICDLVRIRPSVLDDIVSGRDILVAAHQKLFLRDWRARAMFGSPAALVEAYRLTDGTYITELRGEAPMRLFQLGFDEGQHVLMLGHGLMALSARLPLGCTEPRD